MAGLTIIGTDGSDGSLNGADGDDKIFGLGGDDTMFGHGGQDKLFGDAGNDSLDGGAGADQLNGSTGDDVLTGGAGADQLYGDDGYDIASYAGNGGGVTVNLATGSASGGDAGGDTLSGIEGLIGGYGSDTLIGDAGDNLLDPGGGGTDVLNGGAGIDTARFSQWGHVTVDLGAGYVTFGTLISIENVLGTQGDDILVGDGGSNVLTGDRGSDLLSGGAGNDVLNGNVIGSGSSSTGDDGSVDHLYGGDGNDTLHGAGHDVLDGGAGSDLLDGGIASYLNSTEAITARLSQNTVIGGGADKDTLTNINGIYGSNFSDLIMTSYHTSLVDASGGDDRIYSSNLTESEITLRGGAGDDRIVPYADSSDVHIDGGAGTDTVYYHALYSNIFPNGTGVSVDLRDSNRFISVENVYGSDFKDTLIGSDVNNVLTGNGGTDNLFGQGGRDYFTYRSVGDSTVAVSGRDRIGDFSHAQQDVIDLRPIDADGNAANGNTAFTFTSGGAFTGSGHEVIVQGDGRGGYIVLADVNGDKVADMAIGVISDTALVAGDFLL